MTDENPIDRFLSAMPGLPRPFLDRLVERMIDRLDQMDGDIDLELNGDEADGSMGEDDFCDQSADWLGHAGCPVSDPGEEEPDRENDHLDSWREVPSCPPEGARRSREAHLRRIRRDRCRPIMSGGYIHDGNRLRWRENVVGYALKKQPSPWRRLPARYRKRKRRR